MKSVLERLEEYRHDDLLLAALRGAVMEVEGIAWDVLVSASRVRPLVDARRRAEAVYTALADDNRGDVLADVFHRHRTTGIFGRKQHETLLYADKGYEIKYFALLKCVVRRLRSINILNNEESMFTGTISGNLGRNAETRTINEKDYYKFSVGVRGRDNDTTTWVQVLYRKGANAKLGDYLVSGAGVLVQGRVETSAYKGKDGNPHADVTIWADNVEVTRFADNEAKQTEAPKPADDGDIPF